MNTADFNFGAGDDDEDQGTGEQDIFAALDQSGLSKTKYKKVDQSQRCYVVHRGARQCPDGGKVRFSSFVKGWDRAKMYTLGVQGSDQWRVNSLDQGLLQLYDRLEWIEHR